MKIRLPDIGSTYCESLTACGFVKEPSAEMLEWLGGLPKDKRYFAAGYNTPSHRRAYVRVVLGKKNDAVHLHFDLATKEAFSKPPQTTHRRRHIESTLSRFEGATIQVEVDAVFTVPLKAIEGKRGLIHAFTFDVDAKGTGIKLTGAELEFQKAPLRKLSWSTRRDRIWSSMSLERVTETVDEMYLERVLTKTETVFEALNLGKEKRDAGRE